MFCKSFPKAKLEYSEVSILNDLLNIEYKRISDIARNGIGLQAVAASSRNEELTKIIRKLKEVESDIAHWHTGR